MQVAEAVGRALAELGVRDVFGVVGSGNFAVTNALDAAGARFHAARHESAAVCMADGYARSSGRVGVATVHQGPGLTNAMTGLTEAAKARTPLLVLAADTSSAAVSSNFRIEQDRLVLAVGAVPERIHTPASAMADVARAWRTAVVERRAVVLMLPLDVQAMDIPHGPHEATPPPRLPPPAPDPGTIAAACDLIQAARRPAIIGGLGAVLADARANLEVLGERIGAVLATSANGNGLFTGSPFNLGISGGFASPVAVELLADADLVLAFGASLNMWTTRHGALIGPDTVVVQVDLDSDALGTHRPIDLGMIADVGAAARAIEAELERRDHRHDGLRDDGLAERIAAGKWREVAYDDGGSDTHIDPRTLSIALAELLPAEFNLAIDSGHFMGWPAMYLEVPDPAGFVFNQSFQSIGLGLGAAIGAAIARPDRPTVAAVGDGGLFMALGELETAARLELALLVVVYNDAAYGAEVHHFGPHGDDLQHVRFPDTDFAAIGRATGTDGITVRHRDDLAPVAGWLEDPSGPLVVDAKVHPDIVAEWLEEAFRSH